jgi:hypothetical protein
MQNTDEKITLFKAKIILFLLLVIPGLLAGAYPDYLRQGVDATETEIATATEMYEQGWRYTMPSPKSKQAAWGNGDGRTTWYVGWWKNEKTNEYSDITPKKDASGKYVGDNVNNSYAWRRGGSPRRPDVYMFLLSKSGGP